MDLAPFTGTDARCKPNIAAVLRENTTYSMTIYRKGTVDHEIFHHAVVLTDDTAEALYADYTPLDQPYRRGDRPFLERVVAEVTGGLESDFDKAVALMDWVRDLPRTYPNPDGDVFHGGSEEEVIRKGSNMCNEMARVLIVLAQIAGIPSRYIGHMVPFDFDRPETGSGHGVTEMYIDGAWSYFDVRGRYFLTDAGRPASTWELINDPDLIDRQDEDVYSHISRYTKREYSRMWFSPGTCHIVANYLAADHAKYDYGWTWRSKGLWMRAREAARAIRTTDHRDILPQPMVHVR